jgi:hypothetical protein
MSSTAIKICLGNANTRNSPAVSRFICPNEIQHIYHDGHLQVREANKAK